MLGRGAQKRRRENFSTFAGKKKSPSPPASRSISLVIFSSDSASSLVVSSSKSSSSIKSSSSLSISFLLTFIFFQD
jgi:hypothetical protein